MGAMHPPLAEHVPEHDWPPHVTVEASSVDASVGNVASGVPPSSSPSPVPTETDDHDPHNAVVEVIVAHDLVDDAVVAVDTRAPTTFGFVHTARGNLILAPSFTQPVPDGNGTRQPCAPHSPSPRDGWRTNATLTTSLAGFAMEQSLLSRVATVDALKQPRRS